MQCLCHCSSMFMGKVLCCPRDLVSRPSVVVGVVREGYSRWRLGGKRFARICRNRGKRCVRDLFVKDLCGANSFPAECRRAREHVTRCDVLREFARPFTGGGRLKSHRQVQSFVGRLDQRPGFSIAPPSAKHGHAYHGLFSRTIIMHLQFLQI